MLSLTVYPLQYAADLIYHYQALCNLPGFALLESMDKHHGRYDIVTALPYHHFKVMRNAPDIKNAFAEFQSLLPEENSSHSFPFQGGAIGYVAYDLGAIMAGIHSSAHPLLADMPLIDMQFYDWGIVVDHELKQVHLVAANRDSQTQHLIKEVIQLWNKCEISSYQFVLEKSFSPLITAADYEQAFHTIHQEIKRGRVYQVNYTLPFMANYQGSAWEAYKCIRRKNPVPFAAFLQKEHSQIMSFSPERYLYLEDGRVIASPIKGTARRASNPKVDKELLNELLSSAKNRAENTMIVDLLRNDLSQFAKKGSVRVTALCKALSFNSVHHLVSDIEALCDKKYTATQVFASCFPGGSITGAPKLESMRVIDEQERYARGVYCGSIAYFSNHGRFDSNIAIRTIVAKESQLYLGVGGGVVIDSEMHSEYQECLTKISPIVTALMHKNWT